mmetsp:Transcript_13720/g.40284  ORF Transcript_13720/g.40284 Transcript_13720/m.40284 type:complete len:200 (-) Transcript_13720:610-1209(-)
MSPVPSPLDGRAEGTSERRVPASGRRRSEARRMRIRSADSPHSTNRTTSRGEAGFARLVRATLAAAMAAESVGNSHATTRRKGEGRWLLDRARERAATQSVARRKSSRFRSVRGYGASDLTEQAMLAPTKTSTGTYVRTAIVMECPCSSRAAPCSSRAAQSATTCAAVSPSEAYSAHACPASAERTACGVPEARRMGPR